MKHHGFGATSISSSLWAMGILVTAIGCATGGCNQGGAGGAPPGGDGGNIVGPNADASSTGSGGAAPITGSAPDAGAAGLSDARTPDGATTATTTTDGPIAPNDYVGLAGLLQSGQLRGYIHGAVHDRGLYVFTYRKPGDFFSFAEFPLAPTSDEVATQLRQIKRHDAVALQGGFIDNMAPVRHIRVDKLTVISIYQSDETPPPRTAETRFPDALLGQTEAIGKVHAVGVDGRTLVIEYGDAVVPVFVRVPALTAGLYRNDKIRLLFEFSATPPRPTHLWLDTAAVKPLEVLERLVDRHGKPFDATGPLVRFPKSEQISVDVYAVQVTDADQVSREYTLLNNDATIFAAIAAKLGAAWKSRPGQGLDGRNKLVNPRIQVKASGTFSIVNPAQANAQILLDSADNVTFTFLP